MKLHKENAGKDLLAEGSFFLFLYFDKSLFSLSSEVQKAFA